MSEEFDQTGDDPIIDPIIDPPAAPPKKHGRSPKNSGNCPKKQVPVKSHLKLVEEMKAEAAPSPEMLNRNPAQAPGPDPYDLESASIIRITSARLPQKQ